MGFFCRHRIQIIKTNRLSIFLKFISSPKSRIYCKRDVGHDFRVFGIAHFTCSPVGSSAVLLLYIQSNSIEIMIAFSVGLRRISLCFTALFITLSNILNGIKIFAQIKFATTFTFFCYFLWKFNLISVNWKTAADKSCTRVTPLENCISIYKTI